MTTKAEKHKEVQERAVKLLDLAMQAQQPEREQALSDRQFLLPGGMWADKWGDMFANKPKPENNLVHNAVMRIIGEFRQNEIAPVFTSKDGADRQELCDALAGLYRADSDDSSAMEAENNAFEEGVSGGMGALMLRTEYEDEEDPDDDRQRIRWEIVTDADSCVYFDPDSRRYDKADAKRAWVLTGMSPDAYKERYGRDPVSLERTVQGNWALKWFGSDLVYVALYFESEQTPITYYTYVNGAGQEERFDSTELDDDEVAKLEATGWTLVKSKRAKKTRIRHYTIDGCDVLEDHGYVPGNIIPVIPFYGKRWFVDGVERFMGHVRLAKDVSRINAMQLAWLTQIAATSPTRTPMFAPEQMAGHERIWSQHSKDNYSWLPVNPLTDNNGNLVAQGPVGELMPPDIPPAILGLLQYTDAERKALLGNQEQADKVVSNISAKAIEMTQQRMDTQTFIYVSNFAEYTIRRIAQVWLAMAREVYVESGRLMKSINVDGSATVLELGKKVMDEEGIPTVQNDLSNAIMDVSVNVGPASQSRKQSAVKNLMAMMQVTADQELQSVLGAYALMNTDIEGGRDLVKFARKRLLNAGVVTPTEEERQELEKAAQEAANQPPDANTQYILAEAAKSQAIANKTEADTQLTMAKVEQTQVETVKTATEVQQPANPTEVRNSAEDEISAIKAERERIALMTDRVKLAKELQSLEPQEKEEAPEKTMIKTVGQATASLADSVKEIANVVGQSAAKKDAAITEAVSLLKKPRKIKRSPNGDASIE